MNKKSLPAVAIGLLSVVAIGFLISNSGSSLQAGSSCNTQGVVKKKSEIEFVCEKAGNKLIWIDRSNTSDYSFGPTNRIVYRFVNGQMQRLNKFEVWQDKDNRAEADFDPIRVAAHKSINALSVDEEHRNLKFEYIIRPGFPAEIAEAIKLQTSDVAKKLSPILTKDLLIKLILVTEKDKDFIDNELPKIIPIYDWQGALNNISYYKTQNEFYSVGGTGGGTASYLPEENFGYYIGHTSSIATMKTYWPEVAPHEMAHVLQGVFANGFRSNYPDGHPKAKWHRHLTEGSANTVGMGLGFKQLGWYADEMDLLLRRSIESARAENYSNFDQLFPMKNTSDAVSLINSIETMESRWQQDLSYSAGQFIWEFYIGKYGFDKYIELLTSLQKNSFADGIKKTIGISKDQFYQEAAPYLLSNWQRLSS